MKTTATPQWREVFSCPLGEMTITASEKGVTSIRFDSEPWERVAMPETYETSRAPKHLNDCRRQILEYFSRKRTEFDVPLDPRGTAFQKLAWRALTEIPFGRTWSYQDQAKRLGDPKKTRAVGAANGKNPISIIVPCHRVIGKSGSLTGYGGGLPAKKFLLELEKAML